MAREKNFKYIELFNKSTLGIALVDLKTKKNTRSKSKSYLNLQSIQKKNFFNFLFIAL